MVWYKTTKGSCRYPGENCPSRDIEDGPVHGFFCWIEGYDQEVVEDMDPVILKEMKEKYIDIKS